MKLISMIVGGIAALFVLALALGSFYTVDQGEVGVLLRYGQVVSVSQPGLHWKTPLVEDVETISARTERQPYKTSAYSKDIQAADLVVVVNYRLDPSRAQEVYASYRSLQGAIDRVVTPKVLATMKSVFGRFNAATAIAERGRLGVEMESAVRDELGERGIVLEGLLIEDIAFSDAFEAAIEARMQAEVEVSKRTQELEQRKIEAEMVRVKAAGAADARIAQATAEAEAIELQGLAEAKAIDARGRALRDNPALVGLVAAEKWNGTLPTTMVPAGAVPFLDVGRVAKR